MIAYDGSDVWPSHGAPTLREIGVGLGRMPRFAGQTREWYPVLSHSLVVAVLLPPELRVYGLLHDAHEAILGDMPTTWKTPERSSKEDLLQARIYERLGIASPNASASEALHDADKEALAAEAHVLGHAEAELYWPEHDPAIELRVRYQLDVCRSYLHAETAAGKMTRAFDACIGHLAAERLARHA